MVSPPALQAAVCQTNGACMHDISANTRHLMSPTSICLNPFLHTHTHTYTNLPIYNVLGMWPDFNVWFASKSHSFPRLLGFHGYAWFVTAPHPDYQVTGFPRLQYRLLCGHIKTPVSMEWLSHVLVHNTMWAHYMRSPFLVSVMWEQVK